jgi:hypothetical protein
MSAFVLEGIMKRKKRKEGEEVRLKFEEQCQLLDSEKGHLSFT